MAPDNGPSEAERHRREVCNAFARAAVAMRDAAQTAENFSNWLARVDDVKNLSVPAFFTGPLVNYNYPMYGGPQQQSYFDASNDAAMKTAQKRKADEDDVEDDGKKKRAREKKVKDTNAPKKPPSAYVLFQKDVHADVKAANPHLSSIEVLREIAKMWAEVSPEDKKEYEEGRLKMKEKYDLEKAQYDAEYPNGAPAKKPAPKAKKPVKSKEVIEEPAPVKPVPASKVIPEESDDTSTDTETSEDQDKADTNTHDNEKEEAEEEEEEEVEEEVEESEPEPPRKKPTKVPTPPPPPPPVKVNDKKKKRANDEEMPKKKKRNV